MKLVIVNQSVEIFDERFENRSVQKYMGTKLCYSSDMNQYEECNKWKVLTNGEELYIDKKMKTIILPSGVTVEEVCFVIRVLFDCILILNGVCPLHASLVARENQQIVIVAKSGEGKSYQCEQISKMDNSFVVCGDDHIYIDENKIYGNKYSRKRTVNGDIYCDIPLGTCDNNNLICLGIKFENENFSKKSNDVMYLRKLSGLKYIAPTFNLKGKTYSIFSYFGNDIIECYESILKKYMKKLFIIHGKKDYIFKAIMSLIRNDL